MSTTHIWVTGAGKGIGRALALHLAREGKHVTASARTVSDLSSLEQEADSFPGHIHCLPLDTTDRDAVLAAPDRAADMAGSPIDQAVLNAGTHIPLPLADFAAEPIQKLLDVNVMGTVYCMEALLPAMRARRSGTIAVVSSVAGYTGLPTSCGYGASKAALINMVESLKPETDLAGIRLLLINPGFVKTPLTDKNTFDMPFLMDVDKAAERIAKGLAAKGGYEITFPRRFTYLMKALAMLPAPLRIAFTRKAVPKNDISS